MHHQVNAFHINRSIAGLHCFVFQLRNGHISQLCVSEIARLQRNQSGQSLCIWRVRVSSNNLPKQKLIILQFDLHWHLAFSFLFGGSVPHYFYKLMEKTLVARTKLNQLLFLACERFLYTPAFQALSLYTLAIFEVSHLSPCVQSNGFSISLIVCLIVLFAG